MSLEKNRQSGDFPETVLEQVAQPSFSLEKTIQSPEDVEGSISGALNDVSCSCNEFHNETEVSLDKVRKTLEVEDVSEVENETGICAKLATLDVKANDCAEEAASEIAACAKKAGVPNNKILTWLKPFSRIAAAFAVTISASPHNLEAKEAYSGVYKQGVVELNKKALTLPNETSRSYVKKNSEEKWVALGGKEGSTFVGNDLEKLDAILAEKPSKIIEDHTHPLEILNNTYGVVENTPLFKLVSPPSFSDFQHAYLFSDYVKKKSPETKIEFNAIEHNGSWNFSVDADSKFFKELSSFQGKFLESLVDIVSKDTKLKARLIEEGKEDKGIDPRIFGKDLLEQLLNPKYSLYHLVSKESHARIDSILKTQPASKDFDEMQRLEKDSLLPKENIDIIHVEGQEKIVKEQKRVMERYIKLGKRLGIHMKFTPIEEFKK